MNNAQYKEQYGPLSPEELQDRRNKINLEISTRQASTQAAATNDSPELNPATIALILIALAAVAGLIVIAIVQF